MLSKLYTTLGLHYKKYPIVIEGYSDANWITGSNEVKSTSGYVFILGRGAISSKLSKQTCIDRSTMKLNGSEFPRGYFIQAQTCWTYLHTLHQ